MGTVHPLQSSTRGRPADGRAGEPGPCEIIIFPGVRIERHEEGLGAPAESPPGSLEFDGFGARQPPAST